MLPGERERGGHARRTASRHSGVATELPVVPDGSADVVVVIPKWNRNLVKEAEH